MSPELVTLGQYFIDHLPSIIGSGCAGYIMVKQHLNGRRATETNAVTKEIRSDLRNGVGMRIANTVVAHATPQLKEAATEAGNGIKEVARDAAKEIVQTAASVAADLASKKTDAWNGDEKRTGVSDRRTGPADRRGS